jgi:uncharacterized protein
MKKVFQIASYVVKVHSLCNLDCVYCYEYNLGNDSWKDKPKLMSIETFTKLCHRIKEHAIESNLKDIFISFHGGEPLLRTPEFFNEAMNLARRIIGAEIDVQFGMQSNATLMNEKFLGVFLDHGLQVGTSIDGPELTNDARRITHGGGGSYKETRRGIEYFLSDKGKKAWGGILAVIDVKSDPIEVYKHLADLDPPCIDFLEPDGHWDKFPPGKSGVESTEYGDWLIALFDYWFCGDLQINFRRFEEIIELLLGGEGKVEYFGVAPVSLITIATDGSYEAVDQIKSVANGIENLGLNVFDHELSMVLNHPLINDRTIGIDALSEKCQSCEFILSCGGGYYPHRFDKVNNFRNPTIYCSDYIKLFRHIQKSLDIELTNAT